MKHPVHTFQQNRTTFYFSWITFASQAACMFKPKHTSVYQSASFLHFSRSFLYPPVHLLQSPSCCQYPILPSSHPQYHHHQAEIPPPQTLHHGSIWQNLSYSPFLPLNSCDISRNGHLIAGSVRFQLPMSAIALCWENMSLSYLQIVLRLFLFFMYFIRLWKLLHDFPCPQQLFLCSTDKKRYAGRMLLQHATSLQISITRLASLSSLEYHFGTSVIAPVTLVRHPWSPKTYCEWQLSPSPKKLWAAPFGDMCNVIQLSWTKWITFSTSNMNKGFRVVHFNSEFSFFSRRNVDNKILIQNL